MHFIKEVRVLKFSTLSPTQTSWLLVIVAVTVAVATNAVSTKWAGERLLFSLSNPYFIPMLVLSPMVFITFGLTASRMGLALGSASVDSLLTIVTIMFGLLVFKEWKTLAFVHWLGIGFIVFGIVLTQLPKAS